MQEISGSVEIFFQLFRTGLLDNSTEGLDYFFAGLLGFANTMTGKTNVMSHRKKVKLGYKLPLNKSEVTVKV